MILNIPYTNNMDIVRNQLTKISDIYTLQTLMNMIFEICYSYTPYDVSSTYQKDDDYNLESWEDAIDDAIRSFSDYEDISLDINHHIFNRVNGVDLNMIRDLYLDNNVEQVVWWCIEYYKSNGFKYNLKMEVKNMLPNSFLLEITR